MKTNKTVWMACLAGVAGLSLGASATWLALRHSADMATATPAMPAASATSPSAERAVLYWYDPMVPTQRFDKPGKSPFMDMQLVPRYADEGGAAAATAVSVSPQAQQSLGLRVAVAERRVLTPSLDVAGVVGLNERDVATLQARAAGFVERVYARAPGDVLAAGAPVADLLHPDWLAAQQEFLAVRNTGDAALAAASRQRLVLLGMPPALIETVERSGQAQAVTTVTTPLAGLVTELMVRQGMTVSPGMTLARINGLASVWVEAAVPQGQANALRVGQAARVTVPGTAGEALRGHVSAVLPETQRDSRTLRVRVELPNPGQRLRAGQFVQVAIQAVAAAAQVVVPAEAVIRTGQRNLVYVLDAPGRYRPIEVMVGDEMDGFMAITRGLQAGQQVVVSGQFLIDSEASLQGLTASPPASPSASPSASVAASVAASASPSPAAAASTAAVEHETTGTVVSLQADSVTLDHAPVPSLKWPSMTMAFSLSKPGQTGGLKPGDRVRMRFVQRGDEYRVTLIERAASAAAKP